MITYSQGLDQSKQGTVGLKLKSVSEPKSLEKTASLIVLPTNIYHPGQPRQYFPMKPAFNLVRGARGQNRNSTVSYIYKAGLFSGILCTCTSSQVQRTSIWAQSFPLVSMIRITSIKNHCPKQSMTASLQHCLFLGFAQHFWSHLCVVCSHWASLRWGSHFLRSLLSIWNTDNMFYVVSYKTILQYA